MSSQLTLATTCTLADIFPVGNTQACRQAYKNYYIIISFVKNDICCQDKIILFPELSIYFLGILDTQFKIFTRKHKFKIYPIIYVKEFNASLRGILHLLQFVRYTTSHLWDFCKEDYLCLHNSFKNCFHSCVPICLCRPKT